MPTTMAIRLTTIASARNWLESWWRVAPIALRTPDFQGPRHGAAHGEVDEVDSSDQQHEGSQPRQQIDMLDRAAAKVGGSCYTQGPK